MGIGGARAAERSAARPAEATRGWGSGGDPPPSLAPRARPLAASANCGANSRGGFGPVGGSPTAAAMSPRETETHVESRGHALDAAERAGALRGRDRGCC